MNKNDMNILCDLAKKTMEVANHPIQDKRRNLWADLNSMRSHEVPIFILDPQYMWDEVCPGLECQDPFLRTYENWMRLQLYHADFDDDFVTEKYLTMLPVMDRQEPHWRTWGILNEYNRIKETKAFHLPEYERTIKDIENLPIPDANIDQVKTEENMEKLREATGGVIPVYLDCYPQFFYGLSYMQGIFYGVGNLLYQFYDAPEYLHAFTKKFTDNVLKLFQKAEREGWFNSINRTYGDNPEIQAMAYNHEIANPNLPETVPMKRHWIYDCAQEYEGVSPEMFNETLITYMKPIYEQFGLLAYGCCENLTEKLTYLTQINNLRRVAVTAWADDEKCASILGDRYVISWRPNPAEMVSNGFDEERIIRIVKRARSIFEKNNCYWEVNLKDFITVERDINRLKKWVQVVRQALDS